MKKIKTALLISFIVNIIFIFLFTYQYNEKIKIDKKNKQAAKEISKPVLLYPRATYYPPVATDFNDLEIKYMTTNNLGSLEVEIKNRLKTNVSDEYYYLLGRIAETENKFEKALEYYRKASEIFPLRTYFLSMAEIYKKIENDDEEKLAEDMASITIGNKWYQSFKQKEFRSHLQSAPIPFRANESNSIRTISDILKYYKKGQIKDAYFLFNKKMEHMDLYFNYHYDRLIKLFVPYYYNDMTQGITKNYILSFWMGKDIDVYKSSKGESKHIFTEEEKLKINKYCNTLCDFGNQIVAAGMDFTTFGENCYKNYLHDGYYVGFDNSIDLYKKSGNLNFLKIKAINNIQKGLWKYSYKNDGKTDLKEFLKWQNEMIQSF